MLAAMTVALDGLGLVEVSPPSDEPVEAASANSPGAPR